MKPRGAQIGPYEILAPIGAGGMGEVYRARDARLGRDVAIKVLPAALIADPDRRARFEREARLLASLNHPNIAAIYGLEESADGERGLVLELVEGLTLAERLLDGPLPASEALSVGIQVVEALAAAHDVGIVHRDLKPQNIKLKRDGGVKVLDFGLAKALDHTVPRKRGGALQPTVTDAGVTHAGAVLGTPAYMSPEQTRGREIDRRTDVWAFGCVLYELLTGRRAFPGDDVADTIAAVLRAEPDWSLLPSDLSPAVHGLLRRCLEKDPARRLRDIGDVRILIEDSSSRTEIPRAHFASAASPAASRGRPVVAAGVAGAVVLVLAGSALYVRSLREAPTAAAEPVPAATATAGSGLAERLPRSIAVLPLDNLSSDVDDAYFAVGLHDEIVNQLAKLRSLSVISRSSVLRYAENRPPIHEIAAQLRVGAVMEGSVRYAGRELMVSAQLIDPETDSHLWSQTFRAARGNVDELFAIQVEIATAIASALGAEITAEDRRRIDRVPTESAGAYARYLRAQDHTSKAEFADTVRELDAAIAEDPSFAEAYAHRAYIYAYAQITSVAALALSSDESLRNADFQALALADAARALELYDGASLAWIARAVTHAFHLRYREANDAFARALAADPNDASGLSEYALFRLYEGNVQDGLSLIRQAVRFDPNGTLTLGYFAQIAWAAGRAEESRAALEKALALDPLNLNNNLLASVFATDATTSDQRLRTTQRLAIEQNGGWALQGVASGYRRLGMPREAEAALDDYAEWAARLELGDAEWAQYYLLRGDMDRVYGRLERAVETLESGRADAGFAALQASFLSPATLSRPPDPRLSEPRFQALIDRLRALTSR
jgi:TolB-like protein